MAVEFDNNSGGWHGIYHAGAANVLASGASGTERSISAWVYPNSAGDFGAIAGICANTANSYSALLVTEGAGGAAQARTRNFAANYNATTSSGPLLGQWSHIAGTFTTTERQVYLNGEAGTAETTGLNFPGSQNLSVGLTYTTGASQGWTGIIGHVAFWAVKLSADEARILSLGASPTRIRPDKLIAYYPLVNGPYDVKNYSFRGVYNLTDGSIDSLALDQTQGSRVWVSRVGEPPIQLDHRFDELLIGSTLAPAESVTILVNGVANWGTINGVSLANIATINGVTI